MILMAGGGIILNFMVSMPLLAISQLSPISPTQPLSGDRGESTSIFYQSVKSVKSVNFLSRVIGSMRKKKGGLVSKKIADVTPIDEIRLNTRAFLKKNSITIGYFEPGMPVYLNAIMDKKYQISTTSSLNSTRVEVQYLPVIREDTININEHVGMEITPGGASLLVTPFLTGCSIAIKEYQGKEHLSHLQPFSEKGESYDEQEHKKLNNRLIQAGYKVYGPHDYDSRRSTFIGIRDGSKWSFFAQEKDGVNLNVKKLW